MSAAPTAGDDPRPEYPGWGLDGKDLHHFKTGVPPQRWCITKADLRYLQSAIREAVSDGSLPSAGGRRRRTTSRASSLGSGSLGSGSLASGSAHEDGEEGGSGGAGGSSSSSAAAPAAAAAEPAELDMYAVVEDYIKPLTRRAGRMSWALLRHPKGLPCDLFIAHAWAEPFFEFVDKVLASWPSRKRHAWCCAFSMPQNLEINPRLRFMSSTSMQVSSMRSLSISSLHSSASASAVSTLGSPFAVAIQHASHVMIVSHSAGSVFERMWCVYEAYLAYTLDKVIFTAVPSIWPVARQTLPLLLAMFPAGCVTMALILRVLPQVLEIHGWIYVLPPALVAATLTVTNHRAMYIMECAYMLCIGLSLGAAILDPCRDPFYCEHPNGRKNLVRVGCALPTWKMCLFFTFALGIGLTSELDRLWRIFSQVQVGSLGSHTSVLEATCSMPEDHGWIMRCIGDNVEDVDRAIHDLVEARISTPSLRAAAGKGLTVAGAGLRLHSLAFLGVSFWAWLSIMRYFLGSYLCTMCSGFTPHDKAVQKTCQNTGYYDNLAHAQSLNIILFCLLWFFNEEDSRSFMAAVVAKIQLATFLVLHTYFLGGGSLIPSFRPGSATDLAPRSLVILAISSSFVTLLISAVGPHRLVKIPFVGPALVRILGPHCGQHGCVAGRAARRACCPWRRLATWSPGSSTESESDSSGTES